MIEEHHIETTRSARYYTLGDTAEDITQLWFVLHGYGQRAELFIKNFLPIANKNTLVVAPEALSRFYVKGFAGDVGASWMTREDRANEIKDYIRYLNNLFTEIHFTLKKKPEKIVAFGFSQGCPAILRWQAEGSSPANEIVIWSGDVPRDLAFTKFRENTQNARKWMIYSPSDESITSEIYTESQNLYLSNNIPFQVMNFEGGHKIPDVTLKEFRSKL